MPGITPLAYANKGPQSVVGIDWGHRLAPRQGFVVAQHGAATVLHWRGGMQVLAINGRFYDQGGRGFGAQGVSTATTAITLPAFGGAGSDGCTVLWKAQNFSSPSVAQRIYDYDAGAGATNLALWNSTTSRWTLGVRIAGAANQWEMTGGGTPTDGRVVGWINDGTHTGTTGFLDGSQVSITQVTTNSGTPLGLSGQSSFYLANRADGTRGWVGSIQFIFYDQCKRTPAEVAELSKNIWQILARQRRLYFDVPAGGGTTVAPTKGALTFTGKVPTITQTANQIIVPSKGALTFTGYVPTVTRTDNQTVAPAKGALTFTGKVPTVTRTDNQTVAPAKGALTFTGYVPTVTQDSGTVIAPSKGALTFTGGIPTITKTANQIIVPSKGALTFTGKIPTVTQTGAVTYARAPRGSGYPGTPPTTTRGGQTNTTRPTMANTRR